MNRRQKSAVLLAMMVLTAPEAFAQAKPKPAPPATSPNRARVVPPRGYITVGGSLLASENDFSDDRVLRQNAEDGSSRISYRTPRLTGVDASAGMRIWKAVGVRVGVASASAATPASAEVSSPHPFFFGRPRTLSAEIADLERKEFGINVGVVATLRPHRRLQVSAFAGPTFLSLRQDVVTNLNYADVYPYDTISAGSPTTAQRSMNKTVLGAGVDVGVFITRSIGFSAGFETSHSKADVVLSSDAPSSIKFGGVRAKVGAIYRIP